MFERTIILQLLDHFSVNVSDHFSDVAAVVSWRRLHPLISGHLFPSHTTIRTSFADPKDPAGTASTAPDPGSSTFDDTPVVVQDPGAALTASRDDSDDIGLSEQDLQVADSNSANEDDGPNQAPLDEDPAGEQGDPKFPELQPPEEGNAAAHSPPGEHHQQEGVTPNPTSDQTQEELKNSDLLTVTPDDEKPPPDATGPRETDDSNQTAAAREAAAMVQPGLETEAQHAKKQKLALAKKLDDLFRKPDGSMRTEQEQADHIARKLVADCDTGELQMKCACTANQEQRLLARCNHAKQTLENGMQAEGQTPWVACDSKESVLERARTEAAPTGDGKFVCALKLPDAVPSPSVVGKDSATSTKKLELSYAGARVGNQRIFDPCASKCRRPIDAFPYKEKENQEVRGNHAHSLDEKNVVYRNLQATRLDVVNCPEEKLQVRCRCQDQPAIASLADMPLRPDTVQENGQTLDVRCRKPESEFFPCLPVAREKSKYSSTISAPGQKLEVTCLLPFGERCKKPANGVGIDLKSCQTMLKKVQLPTKTEAREMQYVDFCSGKCAGNVYSDFVVQNLETKMGLASRKKVTDRYTEFDPVKKVEGWKQKLDFM
ncbi:unnamed protein product [Amoebophrya sp. A120]|nr:unnamed protein product [Amoebophrya sp. A120]|eukprot:GSA120T00019091001.1